MTFLRALCRESPEKEKRKISTIDRRERSDRARTQPLRSSGWDGQSRNGGSTGRVRYPKYRWNSEDARWRSTLMTLRRCITSQLLVRLSETVRSAFIGTWALEGSSRSHRSLAACRGAPRIECGCEIRKLMPEAMLAKGGCGELFVGSEEVQHLRYSKLHSCRPSALDRSNSKPTRNRGVC